MESDLQPTAPVSFTIFSKLPKELRCMIWAKSSPLRPRVLQLFYQPSTKTWHACKDGCGGLPSIIHVSQEARMEALKGYTWAFDTWVHLEEDTIFISDPVFSLRKPLKAFLSTEYTNRLHRVAIASDVYDGLEQSALQFPTLCPRPITILRKLEGLTHFTLAVKEDGEGDLYGDDTDYSEDGHGIADGDDSDHDSEIEDNNVKVSPSDTDDAQLSESAANNESGQHEAQQLRRQLARLEKEALADMLKGFVRHRGNIHFESAMESADHWDDWDMLKVMMIHHYGEEKDDHPAWVRPKLSIMLVRYGLNQPGDFSWPIHHQGDYSDIELEDSQFPPGDGWEEYAEEYEDMLEEYGEDDLDASWGP